MRKSLFCSKSESFMLQVVTLKKKQLCRKSLQLSLSIRPFQLSKYFQSISQIDPFEII